LKLNQLKALVTVAKAGSILEAARLMHVTQPALSKSIRELERELGVPLLVRSAKGAVLSPYGHMIAKRSRAIEKEVEKIFEEVDGLRGELSGRLSIGLTPPAGGPYVADAVKAFRRERPAAQLQLMELRPTQIADGLRDGSIDLGLISHYGDEGPTGYKWTKLYSVESLLAIGGHRIDPRVSVDELSELEWIALDDPDDSNGYIRTLLSRFNVQMPTSVVRCTSVALYFELARRLSAVTHWAAPAFTALEPLFEARVMTRLEVRAEIPKLNIFLVYQDEDLLSPSAAQFVTNLRSAVPKNRAPRLSAGRTRAAS
jgi:LysR family transcriptional regulator, regulator of abg operon